MTAQCLRGRLRRSASFGLLILTISLTMVCSRAVSLAWDPNPPAEGVEGYKVYTTLAGVTVTNDVGNVVLFPLPPLLAGQLYTFQVTAYNQAGESDRSAPLDYLVPAGGVPPGFVLNLPSDTNVTVGAALNLAVTVTGTPPIQYSWFTNGAQVPGLNAPALGIPATQVSDGGSYYVRVSNPIGTITSIVTTVTIETPPSIDQTPGSLTRVEGSSATFSVVATGTPPLTYQWSKDGNSLPGQNGSSYTIPAVGSIHQGSYTVRVFNGVGFADAGPATLTVVPLAAAVAPVLSGAQPQSQTVSEGALVALSVTVTAGTEPLSFQWYQNNAAIPGATAASYEFIAGLTDRGSYLAIVTNAVGAATSIVAQIEVNEVLDPPLIVAHPQNQSVTIGSLVEFAAAAESEETPTYQWLRNGVEIPGETNALLSIAHAGLADNGEYLVRVSNRAGTTPSDPAWLVVSAAPLVTSQPVDVEVIQGSSIPLQASAQGVGNLSYQWYRNGVLIPGATGSTLNLDNIQPADAGSYVALISDNVGTFISAPATVRVIALPTILTPPSNLEIAAGGAAEFRVEASPAGVTYQWLKGGSPVANGSGSTLTLFGIAAADAGSYAVRVSNAAGSVTSPPATLVLAQPPAIVQQPSSAPALEGKPHSLAIQAAGSGTLGYRWFKNGIELPGAATSILSFPAAGPADQADYQAVVRSGYGSATSSIVSLHVILFPAIALQPADARAPAGQAAALEVTASGEGPFQFQWYKDGQPLPLEQSSQLRIASAAPGDDGKYQVAVANAAGTIFSRSASLIVIEPPVIVTPPQNITIAEGGTAQLNLVATGGEPLVYQWYRVMQPMAGGGRAELSVTDFQGSADAFYTAVVANEAGSATSAPVRITVILSPRIVAQPQSATVNEGSRSSFTLDANVSGSALAYQWLKDETPIPGATSEDLTFSTAQRTDAGVYRLRVSNQAGTALSDPAVLTVRIPPVVLRQPVGGTFLEGTALTLFVELGGDQPFDLQWYRDNLPIPGANALSYTIQSASAEDAGTYTVRVVNPAGSIASAAAQIAILSPPKVVSQTGDRSVPAGADLLLSVRASGTAPIKYQWLKDGRELAGAGTPNLVLLGAHPLDSGLYSVRISSPVGTNLSSGIQVTVTSAPQPPPGGESPVRLAFSRSVSLSLTGSSGGTPSGERYRLQVCSKLGSRVWTDLGSATANEKGILEFSIVGEVHLANGFFRLRKE